MFELLYLSIINRAKHRRYNRKPSEHTPIERKPSAIFCWLRVVSRHLILGSIGAAATAQWPTVPNVDDSLPDGTGTVVAPKGKYAATWQLSSSEGSLSLWLVLIQTPSLIL